MKPRNQLLLLVTLFIGTGAYAGFKVGMTKAVKDKAIELQNKSLMWPQYHDNPAIFTTSIIDPTEDFELVSESPPSVIPFPPIDFSRVLVGVSGNYFYIRLEFNGIIPTESPNVSGQAVQSHYVDLAFDMDRNAGTGALIGAVGGVDILFGTSIDYFRDYIGQPNISFDFAGGNADAARETRYGEYRAGGPGTNFIVARFDISQLDTGLFPRGNSIRLGGWSEAKSSDYHHFAFDSFTTVDWTIPN